MKESNRSQFRDHVPVIFLITFVSVLLCASGCSASVEKMNTSITIATNPADPGQFLPFTITGVLTDAEGTVLGNKKVNLEQLKGENPEGDYTFLAVTTTDIEGNYSFLRPEGSPAEYLRVKYSGNDKFEGSVSSIVQGHSPSEEVTDTGITPSVAKSKTKITAKVTPTNPSPGQSVSITGQLIGENGSPLGNKEIICESSDRVGSRDDYSILAITNTDEKGFYKFGVAGGTSTKYIQIHYRGDELNDESFTDMIVVM